MKEKILMLHREGFLCDLHCDTLMSFPSPEEILKGRANFQTDLPRFIEGGYEGVVLSMYVSPKGDSDAEERLRRMLEIFTAFTELARDYARLALSYRDFIENHKNHKLSLLLGIEGLHPFKGRLEKIEEYHKRGVRVFTLTWNNPNEFADSAENAFKNGKDFGLTPLGKECVKLINDMGGIIDLAHSSRRTFFDTIEISKKPPIVSHAGLSSARELYRNIDDKELLALKDKRGIAAVFFIPEYLNPSGEPKITLDDIVKCYKHIVDVAGIDCAAVGTDFDGTNNLPEGIRGAQDIWKLTKSLLESGFDELSVKKILGLNFLRIFKEACP